MAALASQTDRCRTAGRIGNFMELNVEDITEWISRTRTAQGLRGAVTLDPGLHTRTVAAVDRAQVAARGKDSASNVLAA